MRRAVVVHNGIDVSRFRPDPEARAEMRGMLGIPTSATVAVHLARREPMKDHATLLAALELMPHLVCILAGTGTETLPDRPRLYRLGARSDVPRVLAAADLILSSSAYGEGFSNAIAEGMATGLPAIATDVGDVREIIGDTGWVVRPRDPREMVAAVHKFISEDISAQRQRAIAGRDRIVNHFSLTTAVARLSSLYYDLCRHQTTRP
jgi:glycosyltransferase involved in cell wall biosynthesis